jgi:Ice-binding-like
MMNSKSSRSRPAGALLLSFLVGACGSSGSTKLRADRGESGAGGSQATDTGTGGRGAAGRTGQGPASGVAPSDAEAGVSGVAGEAGVATTPTVTSGAALPVDLGMAGTYVILAESGISTVPTSIVTGNLGVSPAAASYITGFSLTADATNAFATSRQVTGRVYAADYATPTPSNMTRAVADMKLAFTDAAGRAADVTELGAGNIGGMTLAPGAYKWGTGLMIPKDVTLAGSSTSVWIFQVAQGLTVSGATRIVLADGALAKNVFWQVSGSVELGTTAHFEGIVLTRTSIALRTGASINGRLLAQTAVSIDGSTVVEPK